MLIQFILLIAGFALLVYGADWLVKGSATLAKKFGVSELVIGLTIVAFGTSAPELVVNTVASVSKLNGVVLGNVIGSNNFNILIILGITALIKPITVQVKTIRNEIPISFVAGLAVLVASTTVFFPHKAATISRLDGLLLLLCFTLFLWYIFRTIKSDRQIEVPISSKGKTLPMILLIIGGLGGLIGGGKLVVDNAILIALEFGLSERLIGLTIISIGTSLPELATSAVAAYRGNSDLAIGNVIGSNIFNIFLILGLSSVIQPIPYQLSFTTDVMLYLGATLLIIIAMFTGKRRIIDRWEGFLFFAIYLVYLFFLIYQD
jgi:cation:H+ antiporter